MKNGFTSYSNAHLYCPCLPDHLFRLKVIIEAHMGVRGKCVVKINTLARELGKNPKTISREIKELLSISNLRRKKKGLIYEYFTKGDATIPYGRTPTSPIMPYGCPLIKTLFKSNKRNTSKFISSKEELSLELQQKVDKITRWLVDPIFALPMKPHVVEKQIIAQINKIGFETLWDIFTAVNKMYLPTPKIFWIEIYKLNSRK